MHKSTLVLALLAASCSTVDTTGDDYSWLDNSDIDFAAPIPANADYAPDRVIVGFRGMDRPQHLGTLSGNLQHLRDFNSLPAAVYELQPGQDVVSVVEELRASGQYRWAEPDYVRTAFVNDPYRTYQWNFDAIDVEAAWALSTGLGAVVAVIDTGVGTAGTDGINAFVPGYDFVNGDSDPVDDNGHGSHVAGTIAQSTDNSVGVAGIAYDASIMPVKVLDRRGSGYTSAIIDGIDYAVANGADVINMSLGSSYYSATEAAAVLDAYTAGVFVACASGNESASSVSYPGAYAGAVAVGATGYGNSLAPYSNRGSALDLVAPGGDTSVDANGDGYADGILQETFERRSWGYYFFQGTSMASPHVAGAAALLMAAGATNDEAEAALTSTALDLGASGWDSSYGWGLIQPADAIAALGGGATDADGDGYNDTVDCNDADASIYPGAPEVCGDGIDQDCDGSDEVCVIDADGDGFDDTVDCNDADASIYPGAPEVCGDGIDQDCDGSDEVCATGPVISSVSDSTSRSNRTVSWSTDVPTTGEVCNDHGDCATTSLGTSHSGTIHKRGSSVTITATDEGGDSATYTYAL